MGFELAAEREVHVYMDRVRPILAARCISRQLQIFVVLRSAASIERNDDTHTVQIGFDDDAPVDQHWLESSDKQGLFSPDGRAFAAQLVSAHRLRFGFKPFNAPPASAEFDVRGFEGPLDTMTRTCGLASSSARGVRARASRP